MAMTNSIHSSPGSSVRNLDRIFEDAQSSGELLLNCRKLKDYPILSTKYDLSDVAYADLSKNRFGELPEQVCSYTLLEQLDCYNNVIRFIPDAIINLRALTFLDLSRNQLTYIPVPLCHLPIQICILRNNRLVSIPEEISSMKSIRELDVSCNEITIIPPQIGSVSTLQKLNLRRNLLVELPFEICQLKLVSLDISGNRISSLPTQLRLMQTLQDLLLDHNPMTFPPAVLCRRGRIHIFKFLEIQAIKEDKQGMVLENEFKKFRSPSILSDTRFHNGFTAGSCRKSYTFDSGYSTSDCDSRSQESQELICGAFKRCPLESPSKWDSSSHTSRNSNMNFGLNNMDDKLTKENSSSDALLEANKNRLQTYKEFKDALRQQRAAESGSVYKKTPPGEEPTVFEPGSRVPITQETPSKCGSPSSVGEVPVVEKPQGLVNQVPATQEAAEIPPDSDNKVKEGGTASSCIPKIVTNTEKKSLSNESEENNVNGKLNFSWPKNSPSSKSTKSSFTMKREFNKAREEQELIANLRETLESRLKLKLPEVLEPALYDGVFLCHLANQMQPNSVACIHVPSPAVPKLTVAKCRRNVDNFLDACRRLGVSNAELQRWGEEILEQNMALVAPAFQKFTKERQVVVVPSERSALLTIFLLASLLATLAFLYLNPTPDTDDLF